MEMEKSLRRCCEQNPRMARLEEAHKSLVKLQNEYEEEKITFETFSKRLDGLEQLVHLY